MDGTVVVVGAGIAGVACARALTAAGVPVTVLERGRAPGGRMASRRVDGRPVDTGAAYLTARDEEFRGVVADWERRGLARPWTDTLSVAGADGEWGSTTGPVRWAAPGGLRSLVADLADGLDLRTGRTVGAVGPGPSVDGAAAAAVVLAMPDPQAARLLDPSLAAAAVVRDRAWEPVLSLTAVFPERRWRELDAAFVNGSDVLELVADDGRRRGDGAPVLVAHSTSAFAAPRLADPHAAAPDLVAAVDALLGPLGEPTTATVHRWGFARPAEPRDEPYHLDGDGIGLAGDGWGSPRVETAWRSGTDLGRAVAERVR